MTSLALATLVTIHLLNNLFLCVHFYIVIEIVSSFYHLLMKLEVVKNEKIKTNPASMMRFFMLAVSPKRKP